MRGSDFRILKQHIRYDVDGMIIFRETVSKTEKERNDMKSVVVTIDGPAGAGKTTVSRQLAESLRYRYVDTGALYRAVAFAAIDAGVSSEDEPGLQNLCGNLTLNYEITGSGTRLLLNGNDITDHIRTPEIAMMASAVSARAVVREFLLEIQKRMGQDKAAVFEGRDMGTVVFPEAEVKFFLDASIKVRALRRFQESGAKGRQRLEEVEQDMARRDKNDSGRSIAPLKPAADAIYIDSSEMTVSDVVAKMKKIVDEKI
jgi:CMP/dCMP kinase